MFNRRTFLLVILLLVASSTLRAQTNLAHFKLLLIIKPEVNLPAHSLVATTLTQSDIDAITFNYLDEFPWLVDSITGGMVTIETDVVVSNRPITFVGTNGAGGYFLNPEGCAEDVQEFSFPGQYDCIQEIYSLAHVPNVAWGLTFGNSYTPITNYAGICTISNNTSPQDYYDRNKHVSEVFLHEWLHTLEIYYYQRLQVTTEPSPGHLDAAQNLGYLTQGHDLLEFYADHLTGTLYNYTVNPPLLLSGTGFGAQAYQFSTPRETFRVANDSLIYSPIMSANNLLSNPSFENFDYNNDPLNWGKSAFFGTPIVRTATQTESTHENTALYIKNDQMNITYLHQLVRLDFNERYVLVGDVKTQNVVAHENSHNVGAALTIVRNWMELGDVTQVTGTNDWTRLVILYTAKADGDVSVNCGVGYWSSAATGEAWFDNLWFGRLSDLNMRLPGIFEVKLSVNDSLMGTVLGAGTYKKDSTAIIEGIAKTGFRFLRWHDGNTTNPRTITVTQDMEFLAEFQAIPTYQITVSVNSDAIGMGTVTGGGVYYSNTTATIEAIPNTGYLFTQWNDSNQENPRTITVTQDMSFEAEFKAITYQVTVSANSAVMGTVTGGGIYDSNTTTTIEAMPNSGYHFVEWNDNDTHNPRAIIVTADVVYTAIFEADNSIAERNVSRTDVYLYKRNEYLVVENLNQQFNTMQIYDITGRLLKTVNIEDAYHTSIPVNDLSMGILLVNFKGRKSTQTLKFVNSAF